MIHECANYKSLDPADILKRLNTHEFQLAEKRHLYGPSYGKPHALKAKAVSESEGEDSGSSLGDPEELSQELAMLVRKFQKFSRRGRFGKSSRSNDSSSSDYKKRLCHKCKKPGHYIRLSSVGKGIKEEEIQGLQFWWLKEEEEIFKVFIIKILVVFISQEEQLREGSGTHWQGNGL